jgi:hypothetical protein
MTDEGKKNELLPGKVANLEKNFSIAVSVVGILAVIFGVSGAWGLNTLYWANRQIAAMQNDLDNVQAKYKKYADVLNDVKLAAISDINKSAAGAVKQEFLEQRDYFITHNDYDQIAKIWRDERKDLADALSKQAEELRNETTRMDTQISRVDTLVRVLSFNKNSDIGPNIFLNGSREDTTCPAGKVMRGVRVGRPDGNGNTPGSIDCINITPW